MNKTPDTKTFLCIWPLEGKKKDVIWIRSNENLADLLTKYLTSKKFRQVVHKIKMCHLWDICWNKGDNHNQYTIFPFVQVFIPLGFSWQVFNERI